MVSYTISTVLTTTTPSALSSNSETTKTTLTPTQVGIVIGSVAIGLLILTFLIFVIYKRRSHHQKYEHPEHCSKSMDAIESSRLSKDGFHPMCKQAEADSLITTKSEQRLPLSDSQYFKDAYTRPSSSVKNYYAGVATHETHVVSLDVAQSPKNDVEFDIATLRPNSSKSTIKLAPLTIPERTLNRSNGQRFTKGTASRKSSKPPDSGWDTDDSASVYSVASASAPAYYSKSSLETIKPPPVPAIPIHFISPSQSTLPKATDVIVIDNKRDEEENLIKSPLPPPPPPLPSFKFNGDNGEEVDEEDETQIYNVAKLLHSRQAKLPKDAPSRNSSIVSHIERSGSISGITSPTEDQSYRPRYYRLKQKRDTRDSYASNLSPSYIPDSWSALYNSYKWTP